MPKADRGGKEVLQANGVDLAGNYLLKPIPIETFSLVVAGVPLEEEREAAARQRIVDLENGLMKVVEGVDDNSVAESGWGVVFSGRPEHEAAVKVMRRQLEPLLEHRKAQAGALFKTYEGRDGVRDETGVQWLGRHGVGSGSAEPKDMPFFLLFVGPPDHIPFEIQYRVDLQRAVGRLSFDSLSDYGRYASHVVESETNPTSVEKRLELFGPRNKGDVATSLSERRLIKPLHEGLAASPGWTINALTGASADTQAIKEIINQGKAALVMTAGHGLGLPAGHPDQLARQGALVTASWEGVGKEILPHHTFAGSDVAPDAPLSGRMALLFACYGGGSPADDDFAHKIDPSAPTKIADEAFFASLPQKLLAGGMLAVMAHVDRAWSHSFQAPRAGEQSQTFRSTLQALMNGKPAGVAFDDFNVRTGELSFDQADLLKQVIAKKVPSYVPFAAAWTAATDARNYLVLGDPATRLNV